MSYVQQMNKGMHLPTALSYFILRREAIKYENLTAKLFRYVSTSILHKLPPSHPLLEDLFTQSLKTFLPNF